MKPRSTIWSWLAQTIAPTTEWSQIQQAAIDYLEYRHVDTVLHEADTGWDREQWVDSADFKRRCIQHLQLDPVLRRRLWLEILADRD